MFQFRKSVLSCFGWLFVSELLCLVMAFSFAMLPQFVAKWVSLFCGVLAHVLLMAHCASGIAEADVVLFRHEQRASHILKPLLLGVMSAAPRFILYFLLLLRSESTLMLNLYLLFESPYIQLNRFLLNGVEPFSAVPGFRKVIMGLIPVITVISVFVGYLVRYIPAIHSEKSETPVNKHVGSA